MRKILIILFMSLATQAFSEEENTNDPCSLVKCTYDENGTPIINLDDWVPQSIENTEEVNKVLSEKNEYDFCQMDGNCEISSSEDTEEVDPYSFEFEETVEELYPPVCEEVYWEAQKEAGKLWTRYNALQGELFRSRKEIRELKKELKSDLTMMEIVAQNVGQEEAFSTTHAIIYSEFIKLSKKERIELQLVLKARGMYRSELDGTWGQFTSAAFAFYLAPKMQATSARTPAEFFSEIKKGFLIDELWRRENLEKDLQEIWRTDAKNKLTSGSGFSSGSRSSSSSRSNSEDDSFEPFFKQMYINNELKNCLKVGNSWECD